MNIRIGPVVIKVDLPPGPVAEAVIERFRMWAGGEDPCGTLQVRLEPAADFVNLGQVAWRADAARFSWTHEACRFTVDAESGLGWLEGASAHPVAVVEYALRCLVALCAWRRAGLLVHASAVGVENKAVLFVGPSGAGKSTAARLRPRSFPLLADDLIMVEFTPDGWQIWPTPFDPPVSVENVAPWPIGLLCVPVHATKMALVPLSPAKALAYLLESLPLITYYRPALEFLLPRLRERLVHTPMVALHFFLSPDFWPLIRAAVGEHRHVTP